jgi:replicative DNA helicase
MTTRNGTSPAAIEPAQNVEAECVVLGAAIRDPDALAWLAANLEPTTDFFRAAHRTIAATLIDLYTAGMAVDPITLLAVLRERGTLADIGGAPYLHTLDAAVETTANVAWFGDKVKAAARTREAHALVAQLHQACAEGLGAEEIAAIAVGDFQRFLDGETGGDAGGPIELLDSLREVRDRRLAGRRVSWRLENLDALTGGLEPGTVTILGARPAVGKSSLALQVCARMAEDTRTLFVSYEMGPSQIARRQLAMIAQVPTDAALMRVDDPRLGAARVTYEALDFTYLDAADLELERMLARVRALHARRPFSLIAIDYAQLIPVAKGRYGNREQEVAAISRSLRGLARRLEVPVLELVQLSRAADGHEPTLGTLRESGQLEADADVVVLLHDEGDATKVIVAKNRDGATGWTWLRFNKPQTTFSDDPRALTS